MSAHKNIVLVRAIIVFLACGGVLYARRRSFMQKPVALTNSILVENNTTMSFVIDGPRGFHGVVKAGDRLDIYSDDHSLCEHKRTRWVIDIGLSDGSWSKNITFFTPKTCLKTNYSFVIEPGVKDQFSVRRAG